jgi:hypothetical protein
VFKIFNRQQRDGSGRRGGEPEFLVSAAVDEPVELPPFLTRDNPTVFVS